MAIKRKCVCCGKEYEYCPNCHKQMKPLWMTTFDCELCKEVFNIVSAYNVGMINKDKLKGFVKANGIDPSNYVESIRKVLEITFPEPMTKEEVSPPKANEYKPRRPFKKRRR